MMDIREEKRALRKMIRVERKALDPEKRRIWDGRIETGVLSLEEYKSAETVFCFVSYGGEPETRGIIEAALNDGKRVCVPRCLEDGLMEYVLIDGFACLEAGYRGILEPREGLPVIGAGEIDLAVTPGMAFGKKGERLGQGGGFYDRFMAETDAFTCGICYERFILDNIPVESFDKSVMAVVTEENIRRRQI